jgi:hypothetical protein
MRVFLGITVFLRMRVFLGITIFLGILFLGLIFL